jgi:ribosomal protein S18 acetylase RimI-like enzyme
MTVADWHTVSSDALAPLYDREHALWLAQLDWDTGNAWAEVETARRANRLPGVALVDAKGDVHGFTYSLVDGRLAQLGPIVTQTPGATSRLLQTVLDTTRRAGAPTTSFFSFHSGPHLEQALLQAGFELQRYLYLSREPGPASRQSDQTADWSQGYLPAAAVLLQAAYGARGRAFAADGRLDQWERYVGNLIAFTGCGVFDARLSCVTRDATGLTGVALVTTIRRGVSHLAQLAVRPDATGRGLGGRLLDEALVRSAGAGHRRLTLLVDGSSAAATRLYASRGFSPAASFLSGWVTVDPARATR